MFSPIGGLNGTIAALGGLAKASEVGKAAAAAIFRTLVAGKRFQYMACKSPKFRSLWQHQFSI